MRSTFRTIASAALSLLGAVQAGDLCLIQSPPARNWFCGAITKPDVNARARDMEELAVGLVRVLDDKHEAVGQWNPRLEAEDPRYAPVEHELYRTIVEIRSQLEGG